MGGDRAPDEVVKGVAQVSLMTGIESLLVGDERRTQAVLEGVSYNPEHIAILHARDAIGMAEEPREAVKRKDASLVAAVRAVAEGRADAVVSAGNTGACVLACAKHFRLLRGIRRAALASGFPRQREHAGQDALALMLDVGARSAARRRSWCSSRSWGTPTRGGSPRYRARPSDSSTWEARRRRAASSSRRR